MMLQHKNPDPKLLKLIEDGIAELEKTSHTQP